MKRLLLILLVLGGAGVGGYYLAYGRLPWEALSGEDQQVLVLREQLSRIRQQWAQAGRAQALGPMDTGSMVEGPLAKVDQLERDLEELAPKLKHPQAKVQAANLRQEIATFKMTMR
jgi:hypothetical protein